MSFPTLCGLHFTAYIDSRICKHGCRGCVRKVSGRVRFGLLASFYVDTNLPNWSVIKCGFGR